MRLLSLALLTSFIVVTASTPLQPIEICLGLTDIPGESTDFECVDEIDVESFSLSIGRADGGPGARVDFGALVVTKLVDRASPLLADRLVRGKVIENLRLRLRKNLGGKSETFYEIEMRNVTVVQLSVSAAADGTLPVESASFLYDYIKWTYTIINEKGAPQGTTEYEVDLTNL